MPCIPLICRTATTFAASGEFDPEAFAAHLERLVESHHGVYLASGASGEGHALTIDEIKKVYNVGVSICKGKIPVHANQPEQHTARDTIFHAQLAIASGVDGINLYGPEGRHHYRPTDEEYAAYFDRIFAEISYPAAIAPNPAVGYLPRAQIVAAVVARHPEIYAVNLAGIIGDSYFVELMDALTRQVDVYVPYAGSEHTLQLGATGLLAAEANVIPKSLRAYLDCYERGDIQAAAQLYAGLVRFSKYVATWKSASPRWIKIAMRAFNLPGGNGGIREPYLMPAADVIESFKEGASSLGLPEITELLQHATVF